jgi:hypothetical protein
MTGENSAMQGEIIVDRAGMGGMAPTRRLEPGITMNIKDESSNEITPNASLLPSSSLAPGSGERGVLSGAQQPCRYCGEENERFRRMLLSDLRLKKQQRARNLGIRFPVCTRCLSGLWNGHIAPATPPSTIILRDAAKRMRSEVVRHGKATGWTRALELISSLDGVAALLAKEEDSLKPLIEEVMARAGMVEEIKRCRDQAKQQIEKFSGVSYKLAREIASREIRNPILREQVLSRCSNRCVHCGTAENLSIDHIMAVVNGGGSEISNLQALCIPCNSAKGARMVGVINRATSERFGT